MMVTLTVICTIRLVTSVTRVVVCPVKASGRSGSYRWMVPVTTASACASPAARSPSRLSTASRTALLISLVRVGSGVRLSNGSTATVRIPAGSPPPVNLYRQPPEKSALTRRNGTSPGIRRKGGCLLILNEREVELRRALGHDQPGARGESVRAEFRLDPADAPAILPDFGNQAACRPGFPDVLHSIPPRDKLPSSNNAVCNLPYGAPRSGRSRNSQHGPEQGVIGHQLAHLFLRVRPDRGVADDKS